MSNRIITVANLFRKYFFNRTDQVLLHINNEVYAVARPKNIEKAIMAHIRGKKVEEAEFIIERNKKFKHKGHPRIGTYCPSPDGTTRWGCIDIDGSNHKDGIKDPKETTIKIFKSLNTAGFSPYIEKSFSGQGYHVWVFFAKPIEAKVLIPTLKALLPEVLLEKPDKKGNYHKGELEVFPKNFRVKQGGVGSAVWLPYFHEREPENNFFYQLSEDEQTLLPHKIETISTSARDEIPWTEYFPPESLSMPTDKKTKSSGKNHKIWRQNALSKLPLTKVYGDYLTEDDSFYKDWLSCRDPWSPSGDQTPSAGVATGRGDSERGRFSSRRSGMSFSVFDFLMKLHDIPFSDAKEMVADWSGVPLPPNPKGRRSF